MIAKDYRGVSFFLLRTAVLLTVFLFSVFFSRSAAQQCRDKIHNNFVVVRPPFCAGTAAFLQGSTPTGGDGTYQYQWEISDGDCREGHFKQINGATAKDYLVPTSAPSNSCYRRVVVSGECTDKSEKMKIQTNNSPNPPVTAVVHPICAAPTGIITVLNPAPAPGISYSIDGVDYTNTTGIFTGLRPAVYSVTVKYSFGCTSPAAFVTVNPLPVLTGTIAPASDTLCGPGSSVKLTVNGGTSYQWYRDGVKIDGATGASYQTAVGGTYTAEIFIGSCKGKAQNKATIIEGIVPKGGITPSEVLLCGTGSSASLTATGGTSYQWYRDGVKINGATAAVYQVTKGGTYTAELFSATCKAKAQNDAIVVEGVVPAGSITPSSATLCGTGSNATLKVDGGTSYQWYRNSAKINGATDASYLATQGGDYTADIFNATCEAKASGKAVVIEGVVPTGAITPSQAALCANGGSVKLTANGGTSYQWYRDGVKINGATGGTYQATQAGTYTADLFNATCSGKAENSAAISLSTPIVFAVSTTDPNCTLAYGQIKISNVSGGSGNGYLFSKDNGQTFQKETTFSQLESGTYKVVVKDSIGCSSHVETVIIRSFMSTLGATTTVSNITCTQSSGIVTINATGGTSPYQYSVDGNVFQTTNVIGALLPGVHKAKVKDAAGCSVEVSFTITTINSTLGGTATVQDATCTEKGSVTAKASGGIPGYTYSLNGGAYQSSATFSNLLPGSYKITIRDSAGCTFTVGFDIKQTGTYPNLVVTDSVRICPNNTANLTDPILVKGSDTGLVYSYWKDTAANNPVANPGTVLAGTYFLKAVNNQGCATIKRVIVFQHTPTPGKIILSGSAVVCFGQSVTLTATNGKAYQWYLNDAPINGAIDMLYKASIAGTYSVAIDDGFCIAFATNTIQVQFTSCASTPETNVAVPTGFTPNKNGANDVLRPLLHNIVSLQYFKVYNRWGQMIFRTSEMGKGWDGTINGVPQPGETYTWLLECTDNDGNVIKKSGRSLLIR